MSKPSYLFIAILNFHGNDMEYVDSDFSALSIEEKCKFRSFEDYILKKESDVLLLYRGEEQRNIKRRLFNGQSDILFNRIFFFGEKSRHFFMINPNENINALKDINDCSGKTLEFIFNRIFNVITNSKLSDKAVRNTPKDFIDYFSNTFNLKKFVENINNISVNKTKIEARDYYLYWLHTAGSPGIRAETQLVSTSTDKEVAISFSKVDKKTNGKFIFHYFIPKPFYIHGVAPWIDSHQQKIVSQYNLPIYKAEGLYPEQKEFAVKGGLFPHFILGIELVSEKKFVVNSHFKNSSRNDFEQISKTGFNIDQSDFDKSIADTGYKGWIETDLNGNFVENDTQQGRG